MNTPSRSAKRLMALVGLGAMMSVGVLPALGQGVVLDPTIITYAGTGSLTVTTGGNGGQATAAGLNNPEGIAYDSRGNTYISDYNNNVIRVVNSAGVISAFAGTGAACPSGTGNACGDGGAASAATFSNPSALQFDSQGNLFVADLADNRIRKIAVDPATGGVDAASIVSTVAGTGAAGTTGVGGLATAAALYAPHGLALDAAGDLWIANQGLGNSCTIAYVPATAQTITIGGTATALTAGHLYTVAGVSGQCGGGGSGTVGSTTQLSSPTNLALDSANNLYIGDYGNGKVRKLVTSTGVISTVAGTAFGACTVTGPTQGVAPAATPACGDGGPATSATLNGPTGVYVDAAGNIIIGDAFGARVREIYGPNSPAGTTPGYITTIAGTSQQCTNQAQNNTFTDGAGNALNFPNCGDGTAATKALVSFPILISVNPQGNILYVDQYDNKIREILERATFPATNVGATSASLNVNLSTTGSANTIISSITVQTDPAGNPEFIVGTVTGCVIGGTVGNPPGSNCVIPVTFNPAYTGTRSAPLMVVTNGGTFQFGLTGTGVAPQAVLAPGVLSTAAGTGTAGTGGNNGPATLATLNQPRSLSFDESGNYYIGDLVSNEVREVTPAGVITDFAGGGTTNYVTTSGGAATTAALSFPTGAAFDPAGNSYIPDFNHHVVARVDAVTKAITVFAGNGTAGYAGDGGLATAAELSGPAAVAVDQSTGNVYIADAGTGATSNQTIRMVNASNGIISTVAGNGTACASSTAACGDGGLGTSAQLNQPNGLALDVNGNLYIADTGDNRVRVLTKTSGIITAVAGTGTAVYSGDGGAATAAGLHTPYQIQVDAAGDVYIADTGNNAVRFVSASTGKISTIIGNGTACTTVPSPACGDGGPANVSALNAPTGVALDVSGNIYVAESGSNRVRKITTNPVALAFPSTVVAATSGPLDATLYNIGNATLTYTTPASPNSNALVTTTGPTGGGASNAFTQTSATTCGPIYSTTTSGNTLGAGASCIYAVDFTPDTISGNYTGTLVETDNSLYSGAGNTIYPTPLTQTVQLSGPATAATPNGVLTFSPANPTYGTPVTLTETVSSAGTGAVPTGTIQFESNGVDIGAPVPLVNGVATYTTANLPVGSDPVEAMYIPATTAYNSLTSTNTVPVTKAPVTNTPALAALSQTFVAAPGTITAGSTDTFTYTVPAVAGNAPPTGPVVFTSPGLATPITCSTFTAGTPVAATATVPAYTPYSCTSTTTALTVGSPDVVTATYSATDPNYANTPALTQNVFVNAAAATTTLVANPSPSTYGTPVTLTETIAPINGVCPAGPATFFNGTTQLGTGTISLVGGSCIATLTTANLPVGSDPLKVTVPASGPFAAITTNGSTTVSAAPITNGTTPVLSQSFVASPGTITAGSTETFTYTVPVAAGNTPPTGPVVFSSPGLATPITCTTFTAGTPVTGTTPPYTPYSCTSTTTALAVGNPDVVTATYTTGDPNYAGGAPALTQNVFVNAATATTTLVANPSPSTYGTPVTLTETIAPINGVCPAGPATFFNGTTQLGTGTISLVGGSCIATLTTANLPVGSDPLKVTVPASGPFAGITTNGSTTVTKAPVTNTPALAALSQTFVAAPGTITAGSTETFTYTVPAVAGNAPPTGPVVFTSPGLATPITCSTFTAGTPVAATATVPAYTPYSCTSTTTALTVGSPDVVTATYSATDPNYANTPALTQNVFVNAAAATTTLVASPSPSTYGTPVTLTETIAPINGVCPAGPATFFNGTTQLGTGTISLVGGSCIATLTTANLPVGSDPLKVTVPASGPFAAITTNGSTTVSAAPITNGTTPVLSQSFVASPGTITAGSTETFTYTVPVAAGNTPPTGPVVFSSPGLATPITCSTFTAGTPVTGTTPPYTPYSCTSTTTALAVGNPDVVTATYTTGDPNYAGGAPALTQNVFVNAAAATATLTANPSPSTYGTPVTLTETIAPINGVCPAGPATFFNGTTQLGTGTISLVGGSCIATLTTANLPVGTDPLKVTVPASGPFAAITTNGSTTVSKAPVTNGTTPVLSQSFVASPNTTPAGGLVTLVYTIPVAAGNVAPIGPVVFSSPGLATPITCSTFTAGTPVTGTTPPYTPYSCTSTTTALAVGSPDLVTATYTSADPNYANAPALTQNVTVTPVTPGNVITVPPTAPSCGTSVTLTDTITPVNGIPVAGGTVQFYDNGVAIGGPIVVPASGIVTLTTTALSCGPNVITSIYTPPAGSPYLPAPGGPVNFGVNPADFTIAATPPNQVVNPGDTVVYTIALAGATVPFNSPVTLTVTGLPKDATVSFGQTTYVPGQGPTTTTMTIVTSPLHSELRGYPGMGGGSKIAFGLLLLPLLGVRRIRRKLRALPRGVMYGLTALLLLAGLGAVTGCGGGYIGPNPGFYTITVTGTSGALVHSTSVQLEVR